MKLEKQCDIVYGCNSLEAEFENEFTDEEINFLKEIKFKKVKLTLEVEEPILDEKERKYLRGVIRPFRDEIAYIEKHNFTDEYEYLAFYMKNKPSFTLANFEKGTMYKGMESDKSYTIKELGL